MVDAAADAADALVRGYRTVELGLHGADAGVGVDAHATRSRHRRRVKAVALLGFIRGIAGVGGGGGHCARGDTVAGSCPPSVTPQNDKDVNLRLSFSHA